MAELEGGEAVEVQGSGSSVYRLRNVGGVYSCSCPAWRNQSLPIEQRSCKHLRALRGEAAEQERVGSTEARPSARASSGGGQQGPPLLLAERWDTDADLTGWWMSEKLDGVRAYWDGRQFVSRLGNVYLAPDWFVAGLPEVPLDGELWVGRKRFQRTIGIVRRQDRSDLWREVSYRVFDVPSHRGTFEERLEACRDLLDHTRPPHATFHDHVLCAGLSHLREELGRLEVLGGEGLMLRRPGSRYEVGRSATLLKVKRFLDGEARVLEHQAGAGRHLGRLGSLLVELPDGTRFSIGTGFSDAQREQPPALGSVVHFRYQELSDAGVPRFPSYGGVRVDAVWPPPSPSAGPTLRHDPPAPTVSQPPEPSPPLPVPRPVAPPEPTHPAPSASQVTPGTPRRFELVEGCSSKFWEVSQQGATQTVRYGRIGSAGQAKTRQFADEAAAVRDTEKLIREKTGKGYREVGG